MRKTSQIITALALAGIAVAGGAAFTASGVTLAAPGTAAFAGGSVTQNISGASVTTVTYTYSDPPKNQTISGVTVVFAANADLAGLIPSAQLTGGSGTTQLTANATPLANPGPTTITFSGASWLGATGLTITVPAV